MADAYADAVMALGAAVDRAANEARGEMSVAEIVKELRRIADEWEEDA